MLTLAIALNILGLTSISGIASPLPQSEVSTPADLQVAAGIYIYHWTVAGSDLQGSPVHDE